MSLMTSLLASALLTAPALAEPGVPPEWVARELSSCNNFVAIEVINPLGLPADSIYFDTWPSDTPPTTPHLNVLREGWMVRCFDPKYDQAKMIKGGQPHTIYLAFCPSNMPPVPGQPTNCIEQKVHFLPIPGSGITTVAVSPTLGTACFVTTDGSSVCTTASAFDGTIATLYMDSTGCSMDLEPTTEQKHKSGPAVKPTDEVHSGKYPTKGVLLLPNR